MAAKPTSCMMAALEYADHGYPVVAIHGVRNGKCTCGNPECKSPGKHPIYDKNLQPHGPKSAATDAEKIHKLWTKYPFANVAIATGKASGIDVIDIDVKNGKSGADTIAEKAKELGQPVSKNTVRQMTGGGGWQLFYKYTGKIKGKARFAELLDSRSDGNYVVVPPSRHVSGKRYAWKEPLIGGTLAKMPEWMIEWIVGRNGGVGEQQGMNGHIDPSIVLSGVPEGARDETLFRYACSLRARGVAFEEAKTLVLLAARNCKPPFPDQEALRKLGSAWKYNLGSPKKKRKSHVIEGLQFPLTDQGNAERIVAQHGDIMRWCEERKTWMVWGGKKWEADNLIPYQKVIETARKIPDEAELLDSEEAKDAVIRHALRLESWSGADAALRFARSMSKIAIDMFDADDDIINCRNGVLRLDTGELKASAKSFWCSKMAPVSYDPDAEAPRWDLFLEEIFGGDAEMIDWIQKAVGYTLTGHVVESCIFICYGTGANGKTVFTDTIKSMMGDYARSVPFDILTEKESSNNAAHALAGLNGIRYAPTSETDSSQYINEALVKRITTREYVSARFLYQDFFEYRPRYKIWFACNHKPRTKSQDHGLWRRIRLIPFNVTIPDERQDHRLQEKLLDELDGIFTWAVEGAKRWYLEGLGIPEAVEAATREYRETFDILGDFLEERCIVSNHVQVGASELYSAYREWIDARGERPLSQTAFGVHLVERGFERRKVAGRKRYLGIGLKD